MVNVCELVRSSCRRVTEHSRLVQIDEDALARLAGELATDPVLIEASAAAATQAALTPVLPPEQAEAAATLVLALDSINFGSGYHDIVRKLPGMSGAVTMSTSLRNYVERTGPLTGERLRRITVDDCSQIFGQELDDGASAELMGRFATALNDLGHWLGESTDSSLDRIAAADNDGPTLAENLTAMPYFRDVEVLDDAQVHFYKRAQIAAADLSRELPQLNMSRLDQLTAFADNLVPHVLRVDGALRYDDGLADRIDDRQLLEPGTRAEIEIRAAGVTAVEQLSVELGHRAMDIDLALWTRGGSPHYKAQPRHRARSVFY